MTAGTDHSGKHRILMTLDAAGGVWRYAMDLAAGMKPLGVETVFACFGPPPSPAQQREAEEIGKLVWYDAPLDWMVEDEAALAKVPHLIADLVRREQVDLVHLNLPSQAAALDVPVPVVVVSHSCVCTWFEAVRGHGVPEGWQWQRALNQQGFDRADVVVMPSQSHADLSQKVYGAIAGLRVVHNATRLQPTSAAKSPYVFAAGRWWDDGKNGATLSAASGGMAWPLVMAGANHGPNGQYVELPHVDHRGELNHRDTMTLMREAAIVVSPSLYEPFGLAALEAARGASALVLADIPTYRELWDGAALFADPRKPQAFTDAVNRLAQDETLRRSLGEKAQARSLTFSLDIQARAMGEIYQSLLSPVHALTAAE